MHKVLEFAVRQPLLLKAGGKEYTIDFPFAAVAEAGERLGRSLRSPADWFGAPAKDIPVLLLAGLKRHHPDVTEAEVAEICDDLNPEACATVIEALGAMAFPQWLARYHENVAKLQAAGGAAPHAQSADAL